MCEDSQGSLQQATSVRNSTCKACSGDSPQKWLARKIPEGIAGIFALVLDGTEEAVYAGDTFCQHRNLQFGDLCSTGCPDVCVWGFDRQLLLWFSFSSKGNIVVTPTHTHTPP